MLKYQMIEEETKYFYNIYKQTQQMEIGQRCTSLKHSYDVSVTSVCLKMYCDKKRMICDDCINLHDDHVEYCYALTFLKEIIESERKKIQFLLNQNLPQGLLQQIQSLDQKMNQSFKQLIQSQFWEIKDIIQLCVDCINGVNFQIILNYAYEAQCSKSHFDIIKQYPADDNQYLILKFIEQGDSLQLAGKNIQALEKYDAALKLNELVNNLIKNETLRQKKIQIFLKSNQIEQAEKLSQELSHHYDGVGDGRLFYTLYSYRRLREIKQNPDLKYIFSQTKDIITIIIEVSFFDQEKSYLAYLGFRLLILKEYQQAVELYDYCIIRYNFEISFVAGKICGMILSQEYKAALNFTEEMLKQFPDAKFLTQWKHYLRMYTDQEYLKQQDLDQTFLGLNIQMLSYINIKYFKKALDCIEQLDKLKTLQYIQIVKGIILIHIGEKSKGASVLKSVGKNNEPIIKVLILRLTEQYQEALDIVQRKLEECSNDFKMWVERYCILFEIGNTKNLQQIEAQGAMLEDFFLKNNSQRIYQKQNSNKSSSTILNYPRVILIRALTQFKLAQYEKSLINIELLLQRQSSLELKFIKAKILFHQGKLTEAENQVDQIMTTTEDGRLSFFKGVLLYLRKNFIKAIQMFELALNSDNNLWPAIYNKGICLIQSKQNYQEAEKCFTQTIQFNLKSKLLIAYCQLFQGNIGNSIALIRDYQININKNNQSVYQDTSKKNDQFLEIDPIIKLNQGLDYILNRNIQDLQQWINEVKGIRYLKNIGLLLKAKYYHQNINLETALECYNECLKNDQECLLALQGKLQILKSMNRPEDKNEIINLTWQTQVNIIQKLDDFETQIFQYCIHQFTSVKELELKELNTVDDKIDILHCLIDNEGFCAYYQWLQFNL